MSRFYARPRVIDKAAPRNGTFGPDDQPCRRAVADAARTLASRSALPPDRRRQDGPTRICHGEWVRSTARWFLLHGLVRIATRRWAAEGDPQATLISDPSVRDDPYPLYERVRAAGPVSRTKIGHITASHEIANAVLRSDEFRVTSVAGSVAPALRWAERVTRTGALHPLQPPSLLSVEPPSHTRYRTLVSSVFTARAVAAMRADVQAVADRLLDELTCDAKRDEPVDIVERYCARLPVAVIGDILGVADDERAQVLEFGEQAAPSLDVGLTYQQFRDVERGLAGFDRWLSAHLEQLRRAPGEDLMSRLIEARVDGQRLDDEELRATAGLVLVAGFETTVNLLGNAVRLFVDHPDQLAVLQHDPDRWPNAVDEVLRVESPVQLTARTARTTTQLAGRQIPQGGLVAVLLAGANRDPDLFDGPAAFDVTRSNANRHLAFSGGRHYCLGAALARLEGEIALRSLFTRYPRLAGAGSGTRRPTRVLRGWATLPVRLGLPG
jgi:cytochrome P450